MRTSLSLRIPETLMIPASQSSLLAVCFRSHASFSHSLSVVNRQPRSVCTGTVLFRLLYLESEIDMELDRPDVELTEPDYDLL